MSHAAKSFQPLNIAILTVSDTRSLAEDTSGQFLVDALQDAGHKLADRKLLKDDIYQIRAAVSAWIASDDVQVVISTGGTGFYDRDVMPESLARLFDKPIEGFGELFRALSYEEIGTSTLQSRALGGLANGTAIFCLPGSTGACRTGWTRILKEQLDATHKPCNITPHLKVVDQAVEHCESRG